MIQRYPLQWPTGYPRTEHPTRSLFKNPTLGRTVEKIVAEIKRMKGRRIDQADDTIFISSDIPLRNDGLPRADYFRTAIKDKGVAVYFKDKKGTDIVLCCDKWWTVEENMYSIAMTIESLRAIERWGVSDFLSRSFTGFKALPETTAANRKYWADVLEITVRPSTNFSDAEFQYKKLAKIHHPDMALGSHNKMQELNTAFEEAKKYFNQ